jgi:hypothetical protein
MVIARHIEIHTTTWVSAAQKEMVKKSTVMNDKQIALSGLQPIWDACGFGVIFQKLGRYRESALNPRCYRPRPGYYSMIVLCTQSGQKGESWLV